MKRKINRVGTSTLTVSLPSVWAKSHDLKQGDELEVIEAGSTLRISTSSGYAAPKKSVLHLPAGEKPRRRYLTMPYRDGVDEIEVIAEEPIDQAYLRLCISELLGFELVESYPCRAVIRNVATPNENEFDKLFRREFLLVLSMACSLQEDIIKGDYSHTKELIEMGITVNKLRNACHRIIVQKDYKNRQMSFITYCHVELVEQISDRFEDICEALVDERRPLPKQVIKGFDTCVKLVQNLYDEFYRKDQTKIPKIEPAYEAALTEILSLFYKPGLRDVDLEIASYLLALLKFVREMILKLYPLPLESNDDS